ncbi:MAG TPA: DUF4397 domain-containing protein [Burkholderiaceae bacterium]|nr:DUF4397 domain-containing protein [Burkholderiaceae bacterium]
MLASIAGVWGLGSGLALSGCGGSSSTDTATLRFVNGTVDYATADFWVDSDLVYSGLANGGAATGYGSQDSGTLQVSLHPAGSSTAKLTASHDFATDSRTTVLAYGSLATSLTFKYFDESNAAASSGSFKVRIFQGSPSLGALDVYITNTSSLSGLSPTLSVSAYAELSSFVSLDSGTYRIRITSSGDQSAVLFDYTAGLTVSSTMVLTLAIVPRSSGSLPNIAVLPEGASAVIMANELA